MSCQCSRAALVAILEAATVREVKTVFACRCLVSIQLATISVSRAGEIGVRRINLAVPEQSLMLLKSVGAVPHSGGKRMEPGSEYEKTLLTWLKANPPPDATTPPACTKVELFPNQAVLEGEGATQRLVAIAHYSDGTTRDVTSLAAFTTNNERSAAVTNLVLSPLACAVKRLSWPALIRTQLARKYSRCRSVCNTLHQSSPERH